MLLIPHPPLTDSQTLKDQCIQIKEVPWDFERQCYSILNCREVGVDKFKTDRSHHLDLDLDLDGSYL